MDNTVKGKNVVISILVSGTYYPIFCCKDAEFTINQDEIETTSVNSGSSREYEPGMMNATLSVSGVTTIDNSEGQISVNYLSQQSIRRQTQDIILTMTANNGTILITSFRAIIVTSGFNRNTLGYSQSNVSFRITGDVEFDTIITPPTVLTVYSIYITCVEGEFSVQDNDLIGVEVIQVARSGDTHEETSGTPGNHQYQFVSGTGTINFYSSNPFNDDEVIYVEYKA